MYSSSGILMPNIVWGWDLPVLPQLFSAYKWRSFTHGVSSSTLNKRRSSAPHSSSSFSISQWVSAVHFSHWHTKILSLLLECFGWNALFSHVHVYIIWRPDPIFLECCSELPFAGLRSQEHPARCSCSPGPSAHTALSCSCWVTGSCFVQANHALLTASWTTSIFDVPWSPRSVTAAGSF